jgi:hypothetical protein
MAFPLLCGQLMAFYGPSARYSVDLIFTKREGLEAMRRARAHDVDSGGIYDARSAAINIWSAPSIWSGTRQMINTAECGSLTSSRDGNATMSSGMWRGCLAGSNGRATSGNSARPCFSAALILGFRRLRGRRIQGEHDIPER